MDEINLQQAIEERITKFKKAEDKMVVVSDAAYTGWGRRVVKPPLKDYTREEIQRIIDSNNIEQQRRLSENYFYKSGFYRRILLHYAVLLKYTGILIPNVNMETNINTPVFKKKYAGSLKFLENVDVSNFCTNVALNALIYGTYYGLMVKADKKGIVVLDLPHQFCVTRFKDYFGNDIIDFDLHYFDTISNPKRKEQILNCYPAFIRRAYKAKKKTLDDYWVTIPVEYGICFPFLDGRPSFLNIIPAAIDYEDAVETEKEKAEDEIKKIIVQHIPHNNSTNELVFEPEESEVMHEGAVKMLKGNKNVSVLTTYADVEALVSKTTNDSSVNNLEKMMYNIYYEAGTSSQLFGTTSNLSIEYSIKNDMALMMSLANKISIFLTNLVNRFFASTTIQFIYKILPISYYNDTEYIENSYKMANTGYSFLLPALALGINQQELYNIKQLENNILKLDQLLIPLKNSYTQSSDSNSSDDAGRPKSDNKDLSPKTEQNQTSINKQ